MKEKWYKIGIILISVAIILSLFGLCCKERSKIIVIDHAEQIDSLNNIITNLRDSNCIYLDRIDSLFYAIDNSEPVIIKIKETYEKKYTDISNQPIESDIEFFSKYLVP